MKVQRSLPCKTRGISQNKPGWDQCSWFFCHRASQKLETVVACRMQQIPSVERGEIRIAPGINRKWPRRHLIHRGRARPRRRGPGRTALAGPRLGAAHGRTPPAGADGAARRSSSHACSTSPSPPSPAPTHTLPRRERSGRREE